MTKKQTGTKKAEAASVPTTDHAVEKKPSPTRGGSYVRDKDGNLKPTEGKS